MPKLRNQFFESQAQAGSYIDTTGAYMDYNSTGDANAAGGYAQFGGKGSGGASIGTKLRTIFGGVVKDAIAIAASGLLVTLLAGSTLAAQAVTATTVSATSITASTGLTIVAGGINATGAATLAGDVTIGTAASPSQVLLRGNTTNVMQVVFGDVVGGGTGAVGGRYSAGNLFIASNATQPTTLTDSWKQSAAASGSAIVDVNYATGVTFRFAAPATATGNFATFWGTPALSVTSALMQVNVPFRATTDATLDIGTSGATGRFRDLYMAGKGVFGGPVSAAGAVVVTSNTGNAAGSMWKSTAAGLIMQAVTGTTYDFSVYNTAANTAILVVPTGTTNVYVANGSLTVNNGFTVMAGGMTVSAGLATFGGGVQVTGGSAAAGSVTKSAVSGLFLQAVTGSTYDAAIGNVAGTLAVLAVPTGTTNVTIPNGSLSVSTDVYSSALRVSGQVLSIGANQAALDISLGTRMLTYGPDAATNGTFRIESRRSDASNSIVVLSTAATGEVSLPFGAVLGAMTAGAPANGSIWWDGTNFKGRAGGVTKTFTLT